MVVVVTLLVSLLIKTAMTSLVLTVLVLLVHSVQAQQTVLVV